jgi:uncharacterized protein YutE (UPF0331/DUF86 family)
MDDVALNKAAIIERCLLRVDQEYGGNFANLEQNLTRQDSIILNIQRACEASIDLAMHLVRKDALGIPQTADTPSICSPKQANWMLPSQTR